MYFFFFNDTATTEIYTLSLHDALPICEAIDVDLKFDGPSGVGATIVGQVQDLGQRLNLARSEEHRLNSSHPSRSRMPSSA